MYVTIFNSKFVNESVKYFDILFFKYIVGTKALQIIMLPYKKYKYENEI